MEVIGDQWIMKGCIPGSPGCVYQPEELVTLLEQVGFLPLFSNEIPGPLWQNGKLRKRL